MMATPSSTVRARSTILRSRKHVAIPSIESTPLKSVLLLACRPSALSAVQPLRIPAEADGNEGPAGVFARRDFLKDERQSAYQAVAGVVEVAADDKLSA